MPERPKRRKNNKNKRKNKNNKSDPCKSNDQVNNFDNEETCTIQNNEEKSIAEAEQTNIVIDSSKNIQEENCGAVKYNQSFTTTIDDTDASTGDFSNNNSHNNSKAVNDSIVENILNVDIADSVTYLVEPPDCSPNTNKTNIKNIKSKSLDNEDATNIVEITDEATEIDNDISLSLVESQNALITHVESDIEWEVADELENEIQSQEAATGTLSITTIPLTTAQCDQYKSLTPEEEKSLRSYLKTINLVTQPEKLNTIEIKTEIEEIVNQEIKHRLRKKASADDFFLHRLGPPRILDVIDEEGSSESSLTSRRQSYLSDKKSDIDDLEDDVFEDKKKIIKHKEISSNYSTHKKGIGKIIPQECVLVGAKMKDPEVEARGEWTMKMVEKMTGAEVVYLTDTSSSSSSLHEIGDDDDDGVDTDVSIRVITPTIEVTDTENFFKKDFIPNISDCKINELFEDSSKLESTKIPIECYENNNQSHINKNEYVIKVEHENDQKPEIKDDQHKNVIQMDSKIDSPEKCQTAYSENMKHIIDKVHKQESKESHEAKNDIKSGERIIPVEIQKDLKETNNLENMKNISNHEIVVLSTDNIETNLYVKDIDESKFTVEPLPPRNNLNTKVLETDIKGEDVVDKNRKIHKISKSIEEKEIKNLPIQSKLNIKDDHRVEIGQQIPNKQNLSSDFFKENSKTEVKGNKYVLETKVIKCEFNDAINNLINEVSTDLGCNNDYLKDTFIRQDSSSSVDSSQCTAKYNPNCESLNDISSIVHEDISSKKTSNIQEVPPSVSHVKDIIECVAESSVESKDKINVNCTNQPLGLKDLCVHKIVSLPYGDKILEELASVSKRLQDFTTQVETCCTFSTSTNQDKNPSFYRSLDVASTDKTLRSNIVKEPIPPPVQPRHSSLKKSQEDDHWTASKKTDSAYVCLSPSQKMLMNKINNTNSSHLVDSYKKVVHHREYEESYKRQQQLNRNDINSSPYVPFKSQTGSRLLALIRDPNLTRNINSLNDRVNNSLAKSNPIIVSEKNRQDEPNKNLNVSFKPIPPPRPKKYSSSIYESDESDFTDNSMRSMKRDRKFFHHSTGTLNKEIESEVCSIQNMHRFLTATKEKLNDNIRPRRPSLPKDLCEQQMEYIRKKEKEVEAELQRLEALKNNKCFSQWKGPKAPLISEKEVIDERIIDPSNYCITYKRDVAKKYEDQDSKKGKMSSLFNSSQEELLREKMYSEYVTQMAQREERKQHKVIKVTNCLESANKISKSMSALNAFDIDMKVNNRIEKEFISKARERWNKLGIKDPETEDELESAKYLYKEPKVIEHKIKVIEDGEEKDVKKLPSHLQEFVSFTARDTEQNAGSSAIWRPGAPPPTCGSARSPGAPPPPPPPPPIWSPSSASASPQTPRKTFRPVHFEESPPTRRKFGNSEQNGCTSGSESEGRLRTSQSAPVTGLSTLGGSTLSSRLPRAQNPTVTLLQKAREGQLARGANYIQQERDAARLPRDRPSPPRGDPVHALRKEYASESEADRSDYERGGPHKMADAHRKVEGIGPITKDGMPVALRSEVKDPSRWYKKMYDTIHKNKYDDDYVTIRYKSRRGQPPERVSSNKSQYAYFDPRSGYLSEPEGGLSRLGYSTWSDAYDSDIGTGPRRRTASVQEERRFSEASSPYMPSNNKYSTLASARASQEVYKNQPGRIENYVPGKSSVIDKESKQQNISSTTSLPHPSPKDKKDLTATILSKSNMARALKESGYESDSTLVFRRREDTEGPLSPAERRAAYRDLQAGGEPPLRGFRSPAPPRQESPRRYVESDVNIHYRCPVRHDPLPLVPERELARQQAEHMKRLYREQKRNKYLQELQDMQNRRHQDNFTPSQKNILPLNRYDDAEKVIAKALYTFNGQTSRELSFKKGEMIHVRRQIDNNWYEGELQGRIGLFPYNYVEIQKGEVMNQTTPKISAVVEGRARAKFDFTAQTNLELPLKKGEVVVLTRRIDQNWWEGRNGVKTGIFPDSYVTVLQEPNPSKHEPQPMLNSEKPIASPAAHGLLNGTAKRSMGAHSYTPQQNSQALSNAPPATQPLPGYVAKPAQVTLSAAERGYGPPTGAGVDLNNTEPLYVDTNAEAVPYRAMYKYRPQNPDELELNEGDTVYVLEKCDDGWYVGSSQRTGRFGTFPGNYVERI